MAKTKDIRVLVIWNEFTEGLQFVVLTSPTADDFVLLSEAHEKYINDMSTSRKAQKAIDKIYAAAFSKPEYDKDFKKDTREWAGRWRSGLIKAHEIKDIDMVFVTGMYP